ncbi:MAG: hypothetical protein WCT77_02040 [Bacteroidota bacterium]
MNTKIKFAFYLAAVIIMIGGCASENPDLLNPPPQYKLVKIRFVNLAKDHEQRTCTVGGAVESQSVAFGQCSDSFMPSADSALIGIKKQSVSEYMDTIKTRFLRNTNYTFFALPSAPNKPVQKPVDEVLVLSTLEGLGLNTNSAYIKILNAFPDTARFYNVNLGCPNGKALATSSPYRMVSPPIEVPSGKIAVSITKIVNNQPPTFGLYQLNLKAATQYILLIFQKEDGTEGISLLNELDLTQAAIQPATLIQERVTEIRTINFSKSAVSVTKSPDEPLVSDMPQNRIGTYISAGACSSGSQDTIVTFINNELKSFAPTSLEVMKKFTVMVFDSADLKANLTVIAPPVQLVKPLNGQSLIRVVHGGYLAQSMMVSVGARTSTSSAVGFNSGEIIATQVDYGNISKEALLAPGLTPITVFTASQPTQLLFSTLINLDADKQYLFVITNNPDDFGNIQLTIIEESEIDKDLQFLEEGSFTQFVQLVPDAETITFSAPPVLQNAKLYFSGSMATILPEGSNDLTINNKQLNIITDKKTRNLIIATGTNSNTELIKFQYTPFDVSAINYKRRFINVCKEIPLINIGLNCDTCFIAENISYGSSSEPETVLLERKCSFSIYNPATKKVVLRVNDINLPFGKNFTIIFGGNSANGYSVVIQQEF